MNLLKILRKPQYAVYASLLMLLFSCSQYEIKNQIVNSAFNSELYDAIKKGDVELFANNNNTIKSLKNSKNLLAKINNHYGTDIHIPDNFFQLYLDGNKNKIIETSLKNGWLNQNDVDLLNEFDRNVNNSGFYYAIDIFKNKTLSLNLSKEEFSKKNTFVNIMEIMYDENPLFLDTNSLTKTWACAGATVVFLLSLASAISCVTVILCGFAIYGLMLATDELVAECN